MDIFNVKSGVTYNYNSVMKDCIGGNLANNTGGAKSTISMRNFKKWSSLKEEKDWFKPVPRMNTALSPL
jgi:hypothetical protein